MAAVCVFLYWSSSLRVATLIKRNFLDSLFSSMRGRDRCREFFSQVEFIAKFYIFTPLWLSEYAAAAAASYFVSPNYCDPTSRRPS